MTLFEFMGAHQILTFLLATIISGMLIRIAHILRGRG